LSHQPNDAFIAINRLLAAGESVYWLKRAATQTSRSPSTLESPAGPGTIYIPIAKSTTTLVQAIAKDTGLRFERAAEKPAGEVLKLEACANWCGRRLWRIDWPSGWLQWLFTQFGFPFEVVYPPHSTRGLASRFDVLVSLRNGLTPDFTRPGRRR